MQEEIDALVGSVREQEAAGAAPEKDLTQEEKDALGEIGNIAMGSAATPLSTLLGRKVAITSPRVYTTTRRELLRGFRVPYLVIEVTFTEGLSGSNLLVIKERDAAVIANLMMGGDGTGVQEELGELELSAASEAMNQMMGSAATAMSTVFNRRVAISPPQASVLKTAEDVDAESELHVDEPVVVTAFKMTVDDLLDTEILQLMGVETARSLASFLWQGVDAISAQPAAPTEETAADAPPASAETPAAAAAPPPVPEPQPYTPPAFDTGPATVEPEKLDLLLDIPLKVTVVLGRTRRPIRDVLKLGPGAIVELDALADEPVEILVNGVPVARGEVVVVGENFGVKITSIISPRERVEQLQR
ncbi:MAG: CheC, inhibitor of MCP methylation / FliN fusion protein [Clostridia bacterium 62_21]|nr:MAG: CheC, inhibitor of MCP methylation / FliN fusion protein [Clostridia bacterium 62_21]